MYDIVILCDDDDDDDGGDSCVRGRTDPGSRMDDGCCLLHSFSHSFVFVLTYVFVIVTMTMTVNGIGFVIVPMIGYMIAHMDCVL